jgi:spore photoproduct lyase
LKRLIVPSLTRKFSHIYIEREAFDYPDTRAVLERFPRAKQVVIERFSEILNRPHQEWRLQKKTQKLVLAVRREGLIYPMPDIVQSVGSTPAFYNTPLINCLYDCSYCYLQGMYRSANIVVFVNSAAFFEAARHERLRHGSIYLSLSYDTDLLGFEGILPLTGRWIEFAREDSGITIEIRTKSAGFSKIAHLRPVSNAILAWTVSPEPLVNRFEHLTASLAARLTAARAALDHGWRVRLVFDPILWSPTWREEYGELIQEVGRNLPWERIEDVTVGVFRMNGEFFKNLKRLRPAAAVEYGTLQVNTAGIASYPPALEAEMREFMVTCLRGLTPRVFS